MPSAFISYAHEDEEFVLALAQHMRGQEELEIRYDQVALHIGDSLIRAISQEIADGDFLIAVISPDSVQSEWCRKELSLAMTQGIDQRRVKVLPVRYRGAEMPPELQDTYWGDADRDHIEVLARRVAAAMRVHLEGGEAEAAREAAAAEQADGRAPPHAEVAGDLVVAQIEDVAQRVFDVLGAWGAVWTARGNLSDIEDPQRRLRWALDVLPDQVRVGLPLVERLAAAAWGDPFFGVDEAHVNQVEQDVRDEMRSVRTQVAQGLPVTRRWIVDELLDQFAAERRDARVYLWQIGRDGETFRIAVYISGTALEAYNESLPRDVANAKETEGRSVVATLLSLEEPPSEVMVSTAGISWPLPD